MKHSYFALVIVATTAETAAPVAFGVAGPSTPFSTPIGGACGPTPTRSRVLAGAPGSGVTLSTGDNLFALTIRVRIQLRETVSIVPSGSNDAGIGLNWYRAGHLLKLQTDYRYSFGTEVEHGRQLVRVALQASF